MHGATHMVDRTHLSTRFLASSAPAMSGGPETRKGVNYYMSISELLDFVRQNWRKEEGQTMAEYAVVLTVITLAVVGVFAALSGGITNAINNVSNHLP
jgi:Flp pilus assembly pilin Flp